MIIFNKRPRKLRCLMMLSSFILLISLILGGFTAEADAIPVTEDHPDLKVIYVNEGDTLWELVEQYYYDDDSKIDQDIRKTIYEVEKFNNVENSQFYNGQILYLPSID